MNVVSWFAGRRELGVIADAIAKSTGAAKWKELDKGHFIQ